MEYERWPVFLTAENVSPKSLNRAFVFLQDYVNPGPGLELPWFLVTSEELPSQKPEASILPLNPTIISNNHFAGHSPILINDFVRSCEWKLFHIGLSPRSWLIIDQRGIKTDTCIVAHQDYSSKLLSFLYLHKAARAPYMYVFDMINSLNTVTTLFRDWVDMQAGEQEDGSHNWVGRPENSDETLKRQDKIRAALKAMQELGHVD